MVLGCVVALLIPFFFSRVGRGFEFLVWSLVVPFGFFIYGGESAFYFPLPFHFLQILTILARILIYPLSYLSPFFLLLQYWFHKASFPLFLFSSSSSKVRCLKSSTQFSSHLPVRSNAHISSICLILFRNLPLFRRVSCSYSSLISTPHTFTHSFLQSLTHFIFSSRFSISTYLFLHYFS